MDIKGEVLLQLFNKSKLRNETKTFLKVKIFSVCDVKFKKLGFSAPFSHNFYGFAFFIEDPAEGCCKLLPFKTLDLCHGRKSCLNPNGSLIENAN